jgi:hypothetical protein
LLHFACKGYSWAVQQKWVPYLPRSSRLSSEAQKGIFRVFLGKLMLSLRKGTPLPQSQGRVITVAPPSAETITSIEKNNYLAFDAGNVTSQGGEDGVIRKILDTVGIRGPGWCVEFGACDGQRDSNTWDLVKNNGWKAVYVEPEPGFFVQLKAHCEATPGTWCFNDFVSWEGTSSLEAILARTPIPEEFELMVVDIDGADYYVWETLEKYHPQIVCIEFHRLINPSVFYVPSKEVAMNRPSSLRALYELGKRKGYELVCVINWNAFFVRREHFEKFGISDNRPGSMYWAHEEMRLVQGYDGTLFLCGNDKHYWKYQRDQTGVITNITITHEDIQVLPQGLRIFQPRHTYRCGTMEAQAGKLDAARVPANTLLRHRRNVTSENGEDGILEYIFNTIGVSHRLCVDVGACDGLLWSNTRNIIAHKGWRGVLIEADDHAFVRLCETYRDSIQTQCVHARMSSGDRLEALLTEHKVPRNFDLLCIDIEGNDYHLLRSLKTYVPAVIVVDFNPSVPNDITFIQEDSEHVHYGASLRAFAELADRRQYDLAAVTDWNAIFVRRDLFPKLGIAKNQVEEMYIPPFEMRMFQTLDGCTHLTGCTTLMRQDYRIAWEDFQVLPAQLRGRDNSSEHFGTMRTIFYP